MVWFPGNYINMFSSEGVIYYNQLWKKHVLNKVSPQVSYHEWFIIHGVFAFQGKNCPKIQ